MKPIVILYHKNCFDGFGAAWAAYKKFGKKAEYIGVEHQAPMSEGLSGKEIYFVDFCYQAPVMAKLRKVAKSIAVIDHHVTAKEITESFEKHSYAVDHSGSYLAWKYFHPQKSVPKLILHIEDTDLWKFKLAKTKEIIAALGIYDLNFKLWDKLATQLENLNERKKIIEKGEAILRYQEKVVERALERAEKVIFEGKKTLAVNSWVQVSKIGNALAEKFPPMAIIWSEASGKVLVSLRSNGKLDVSKLAQKYGGGGHKAAAGFTVDSVNKLPWKKIKS